MLTAPEVLPEAVTNATTRTSLSATPSLLSHVAYPVALLMSLTVVACGNVTGPATEEAAAYLNHALDIMETWSIRRNEIEWPSFRKSVLKLAAGAETPADTYGAIGSAITLLGDGHSFFREPSSRGSGSQTQATGQRLGSTVGYVLIPGFSGPDPNLFATDLQAIIRDVDTVGLCGWIVDLRSNGGGNMWPMLAGIGPILGEGVVGAFIDPDGFKEEFFYENGAAGLFFRATRGDSLEKSIDVRVDGTAYQLLQPSPPVAVLTGRSTASSGEAIVTAFRGRPDTRSFGVGTRGLSTANGSFPLSDGARLILTVATFADRTGQLYGGVIEPDEFVGGQAATDPASGDDPVVGAAITWLTRQASRIGP